VSELPSGWVEVELGEVFHGNRRSSAVPAKEPDRRFELYSVPSFETGAPERLYGSEIGSAKQGVAAGSVLLCRINPRINRVWVVGEAGSDPQIASTEWVSLPRVAGITPRFAMQALRTPQVRQHLTSSVSGVGGSLMRVRMDALWRTKIPLAPLPEQHRIVAKIESLFARLDEGVAALKRAEANLERYRASVLKAAVEGRLTEQWRRENPPTETGEDLLRRILAERRRRWEAEQLAKFEAKGRKPPKNWRAKYKEPVAPDSSGLPGLPEGWCWATVDQVSDGVHYGSSTKTSPEHEGVPVLRMGNIQDGMLNLDNLKYLPPDHPEFPRLLLTAGDLLFNRTNSAELVGKTAVYPGRPNPCSFASYLIRVRLLRPHLSQVVANALNGPHGRAWVASVVSQQVGQANVNGTKLRAFPFPLPPETEQEEIVRQSADAADSVTRSTEAINALLQHRATALRQSILKRAFEGRLVPQDPADEPASVLLDRIRAEREAERKRRKPRPRNRRRQPKSRVP